MDSSQLFPAATAPNTCQHTLPTRRGDYLVQAAWPLAWGPDRTRPTAGSDDPVPIIYLLDGNAYFFSATELVRRAADHVPLPDAVIVSIGYPLSSPSPSSSRLDPGLISISARREADFTPPSPSRAPVPDPTGDAADFLAVIETDIVPFVERTLFPHVFHRPPNEADRPGLSPGPRALWGHSRAAPCVLYALSAATGASDCSSPRPAPLFDTFIAASPATMACGADVAAAGAVGVGAQGRAGGGGGGGGGGVGVGDDREEEEKRKGKEGGEGGAGQLPQLFLMYGAAEQFPQRRRCSHEPEELFAARRRRAAERRVRDNAIELGGRLRDSGRLRKVWLQEFEDEDEAGAALCALGRGIVAFLDGRGGT